MFDSYVGVVFMRQLCGCGLYATPWILLNVASMTVISDVTKGSDKINSI